MDIITGMHRSGTSLIANLLFSLGTDFGPSELFLKANKWNTKGYFENRDIIDLNNRLIIGDWASIDYWIAANENHSLVKKIMWNLGKVRYLWLPSRKEISRRAARMEAEIEKLSATFESRIVKDTRFSLTISDWMRYGNVGKILYCYRNPTDVALSLKKRDSLPMVITYRLWYEHVRRLFESVDGYKITVVNYDNFFREETREAELDRVLSFANISRAEVNLEAVVGRVLDADMRHNASQKISLPRYVQSWYTRLNEYHAIYKDCKDVVNRSPNL